tara:strand:+ start:3756 stop:4388 length:633 start_codon:yes stop_codon:yes gene_type:complete
MTYMLNFKKNKYDVLKNVLRDDYCHLFAEYFRNKAQTYETMLKHTFISEFHNEFGTKFDRQVLGAYSCYGDIMMEMLLVNMHALMEKNTGLRLQPNYSYARIYKTGHVLERHKDRLSCEISTTLNLGGDPWPIYLEPSGREGMNGLKVDLNPGDMLIYRGMDLEHWREPFQGSECIQVFLHYNDVNNPNAVPYDGRPHLGLPAWFKKRDG